MRYVYKGKVKISPDKFSPIFLHIQLFPESLKPSHSCRLLTTQLKFPAKNQSNVKNKPRDEHSHVNRIPGKFYYKTRFRQNVRYSSLHGKVNTEMSCIISVKYY